MQCCLQHEPVKNVKLDGHTTSQQVIMQGRGCCSNQLAQDQVCQVAAGPGPTRCTLVCCPTVVTFVASQPRQQARHWCSCRRLAQPQCSRSRPESCSEGCDQVCCNGGVICGCERCRAQGAHVTDEAQEQQQLLQRGASRTQGVQRNARHEAAHGQGRHITCCCCWRLQLFCCLACCLDRQLHKATACPNRQQRDRARLRNTRCSRPRLQHRLQEKLSIKTAQRLMAIEQVQMTQCAQSGRPNNEAKVITAVMHWLRQHHSVSKH